MPATAAAQDTKQTGEQLTEQAGGLAEIIVTAEHRNTSVQDTPIAITAFEGQALSDQGIVSVEGLSQIAPSVQIYAEQVNNEEYIIRGIGKANEDLSTDSGVAINLNGAYLAQSGESNAALFDIERVEVLRGPQGTLYGKNAVGGVVNIITRQPTDELDGYLLTELGSLGRRQFEAAVGGALIEDKLSARIAGFSLHTSGAYRNLTTGERANGVDAQAMRASLRFTPNDSWEINLIADYSDLSQDGVLKSVIVDEPGLVLRLNDYVTDPLPGQEDDIRSARSDFNGEQGIRQWGGLVKIDRKGEAGTLSLLSAYRGERSYNSEDVDRSAAPLVVYSAAQKTWATSQELRFVSADEGSLSAGGKLHWSTGLYWFHEKGWRDQDVIANACTPANRAGNIGADGFENCDPTKVFIDGDGLGGPGNPSYQNSTASFRQRITTDSVAAYGEATYDLTSVLSATVGLRYTVERKRFGLAASSVSNEEGIPPFSLFLRENFETERKKTWRRLTPKFVLQFEPNSDLLAYASYARGFKSGGFNGQASAPDETVSFDPETADNFEIGAKVDLFERRLRFNLAAFYIKFDDLQIAGVDPRTDTILTSNAADARIKGLELDAWVEPLPGVTLNGSVSLLDPTFKNFTAMISDVTVTDGPPFRIVDLSGTRLYNVAKYAGTLGAQYEHVLGDGSTLRIGADARFRGNTRVDLTVRSKAFATVDARVGWASADQRWDITAWVRNLTDEVYYPGGGAVPDYNKDTTRVGLVADPRTAGVTLKMSFGQ